MAVEHGRVGHGARRDDPGDVAVDQCPAAIGRADLLANGDFVTGRDEAGDVAIRGVMGDAGHGNADALAHLAAGEHDVQDARRDLRVLLERLVEIAEAKEEDGVGEAALDLEILAADRGRRRRCEACVARVGASLGVRRAALLAALGVKAPSRLLTRSARGGERGRFRLRA